MLEAVEEIVQQLWLAVEHHWLPRVVTTGAERSEMEVLLEIPLVLPALVAVAGGACWPLL